MAMRTESTVTRGPSGLAPFEETVTAAGVGKLGSHLLAACRVPFARRGRALRRDRALRRGYALCRGHTLRRGYQALGRGYTLRSGARCRILSTFCRHPGGEAK